ncbi:25612_t:CDS:2, partial [Gigaspora margarita]
FESSSTQLEGCEIEDTHDYEKTLRVVNDDLTLQNMNATLTNAIEKLNLNDDKLFLNSNSIGSFLTTNFDVLFNKNNIVNISFESSFEYSASIENLEKYLKEWLSQFDYLSSLKHKVDAKGLKMLYDLKVLNIQARQERRYWRGIWYLVELLNLTRCSAITLVEARITAKFLMKSTVKEYDCFLKSLLNDNYASYQSPEFDSTIIQ